MSLYRRSFGERVADAGYAVVCVLFGLLLLGVTVITFCTCWVIVEKTFG